jgi:6-pyruvoyl-tetrahydropterin synthase
METMVNIIKEEIALDESLKKKLKFICDFAKVKPTIINGIIRRIDKTNLTYIEPHRIIINNTTFLAFNYSNEIFIENLFNKIKLSELEDYLKSIER